uniref:Cilia and flagella associated protein 99 n=1 Tax=Leptobrachium leishanense TaxID=445787 RepID=A0A8C5LSH8_9ANUR
MDSAAHKRTDYRKCVKLTSSLLLKYRPENQSLEHFLEESSKDLETLDTLEERFVVETLSGSVQYNELLDIVVDGFYARNGKNLLLSERCLYIVIAYIAAFKLDEYGSRTFTKIVNSQDSSKMCKFLRFFFNDLNLNTWIKDEWSHIYDSSYVKENWINPLLKWQPEIQTLISSIGNKIKNGPSPVKGTKITQTKEFNLTKPKPRSLLSPQRIPMQQEHQPVPDSTYKPPKEHEVLQTQKQRNRQKAEELLMEANMAQFKCANAEKSQKTKQVISEIIKEEENKLAFNKTKALQAPTYKGENVPVRLNAATILREGALYQRQVEEELRRVEKLVDGARDPSEFLEWQRQQREKDLEQQLAEIECRRLEGKLSHEEAVLARQNLIQENKKKALMKKEETAKMMRQYAEKRLQEEKDMRDLVEQVAEGHKNTKQARIKLQKYKQQIVQEVTEESQELLRQALEEAEEELRRKFELICEIRAIESVPVIRHKFVDMTETGGHRLNCEMSLVELHERLAIAKEAQRTAEEDKRDQILNEKQAKQQLLLDTLEQISFHRAAMGKASVLKTEEKKTKSQLFKATVAKDDRVTELQRKLEEKTAERKKQAESLKLTPSRNSRSSKISFDDNHWKELEESRERQAQLLQCGHSGERSNVHDRSENRSKLRS